MVGQARGLLETFCEAGGTLVDTAAAYGAGDAERLVGRLVDEVTHRDDVVIASKAGFVVRRGERVVDGVLLQEGYQPADFGAERQKDCFAIARWQDDKGGYVQATDAFPFCYADAFQYFTPVAEQGD